MARGDRDARGELTPPVDTAVEADPEGASSDGPMVKMPQVPADAQSISRLDAGIPDHPGATFDLPLVEVDAQPMPCQMDDDCEPGLYCDYSEKQLVWRDSYDLALGTPGSCRPIPCGDAGCPDMPCTRYSDCTKDGKDIRLACYRPRLGCLPQARCASEPSPCSPGCVTTVGEGGFCWACLCPHC